MTAELRSGDDLGAIQSVTMRLVCPFSFSPNHMANLATQLETIQFKNLQIWSRQSDSPPSIYTQEVLSPAVRSIFGTSGETRYFRLTDTCSNAMFSRNFSVEGTQELPTVRVLQPWPGIEMFLSPFGVGVLSIAIELDASKGVAALSSQSVLDINHALCRMDPWAIKTLRISHPSDDQKKWNSISSEDRGRIPNSPLKSEGLENRLNAVGGQFTLQELTSFVLSPFFNDPSFEVLNPSQLCSFTILEFADDIEFHSASNILKFDSLLASLAGIDDSKHPKPTHDSLDIHCISLNRNHVIGMNGSSFAQLVSRQADEIQFNAERVSRCRDRYFVPYLQAMIQRLAALRSTNAIGITIEQSDSKLAACAVDFRRILRDIVEFSASNRLSDFSNRNPINRTYHLAIKALRVSEAWKLTESNVQALDTICRTEQQESLMMSSADSIEKQTEILEESRVLHAKLEWVEVFLVSVYVAELLHIVGLALPFQHSYVGWVCMFGSLSALLGAMLVLKPWHSLQIKELRLILAAGIIGLIVFVVLGYTVFKSETHD